MKASNKSIFFNIFIQVRLHNCFFIVVSLPSHVFIIVPFFT